MLTFVYVIWIEKCVRRSKAVHIKTNAYATSRLFLLVREKPNKISIMASRAHEKKPMYFKARKNVACYRWWYASISVHCGYIFCVDCAPARSLGPTIISFIDIDCSHTTDLSKSHNELNDGIQFCSLCIEQNKHTIFASHEMFIDSSLVDR